MINLKVKRMEDNYYIVRGFSKLKTSIFPIDMIGEPANKEYPLKVSGKMAIIELENGKEVSTGFHIDYVKRYFEI